MYSDEAVNDLSTVKNCNCNNKNSCPMEGKCLEKNIIYKAEVTSTEGKMSYIGCTEKNF